MSFDDPFNNDNTFTSDGRFDDEDPAAEFLERERRQFGDITSNGDAKPFEDTFNTNNNPLTNGSHSLYMNINDSNLQTSSNRDHSPYQALSQLNEPEKIRKWREEFSTRINRKDAEEEIKRNEMREQARKELDDFYRQRLEQLERIKGQNRLNNRTFEENIFSNGNNLPTTPNGKVSDWDKITSLCDFNPKNNRSQKDLTRYRSVLLQLKQQQTNGK